MVERPEGSAFPGLYTAALLPQPVAGDSRASRTSPALTVLTWRGASKPLRVHMLDRRQQSGSC